MKAMYLFYAPDIIENPVLPEEESVHCVRVLRQRVGDEIYVTDGKGSLYKTRIVSDEVKHCVVEIADTQKDEESAAKIFIAVAPTKNMDRMEWLVEKLTEIGADGIFFLNCRFSERRVVKTERLNKIAVSAMKQSERHTLPQIGEITDYEAFLKIIAAMEKNSGKTWGKFICHCYPETEAGPRGLLKMAARRDCPQLVLIGPEGDFSLPEVKAATAQGYEAVSLGDMRLRTETAALVAALTLKLNNM